MIKPAAITAICGALGAATSMPIFSEEDAKPAPCSAQPYRQFDFWVGSWDVSWKGKKAGTNRIEKILNGCALHENWRGTGGLNGNSINFYDAPRELWHQTWIDGTGEALVLEGQFTDGAMRLQGQRPGDTPGQMVLHRLTWTPLPDGTLRQLWESSPDSGKTWTEVFDGLYKPSK